MNETKETPLTERASGADTGTTNPIIDQKTTHVKRPQTPVEILFPLVRTAHRLKLSGLVCDLLRLLRKWEMTQ